MPSWYIKAAVQATLSLLPQHRRLNYIMQRYVTRQLELDDVTFEWRVRFASNFLQYFQRHRLEKTLPDTILDLGTGWHPIIPICLALCGAPRIITVDLEMLFYANLIEELLLRFRQYGSDGRLAKLLPQLQDGRLAQIDEALAGLRSTALVDSLQPLNIEVIIADARRLPLASETVDCFISTYTLEHIPGAVMRGIFTEFHRLAASDALMIHLIDLKDHYSYFDKQLSPYNFLRYSEQNWRWFNNRLHYLNRYRISDYRRVHEDTGFTIIDEKNDSGDPARIAAIPVSEAFAHCAPEDLLVTRSWLISQKSG